MVVTKSFSQYVEISKIPNRLLLSFETVDTPKESDLGFVGIGFELAVLKRKKSSLFLGLNSYSAVTGKRPGLITLGVSGNYRYQILNKEKLYAEIGGFVGGGGGGGADDGGGLIIRPHLSLEKQFGKLGLRLGYSLIDFPTGSINGNQFNIGLTLNGLFFLKTKDKVTENLFTPVLSFQKLRMASTFTQYFNFKENSFGKGSSLDRKVSLAGIQIERDFSKFGYGIFKINGSLAGGADGYLSILLGAGGKIPLVSNVLNIESRVLVGPSGGGDILSGGGATMQVEGGVSAQLKNNYLKLMYGNTFAPWGNFNAKHFEITLGKSFDRFFPKLTENQEKFSLPKDKISENHLSFSVYNRTYFSPNALDKNKIPYNSAFNLIGFDIQKYLSKKISVIGSTIWAYEGGYGAYAEGLVGGAYHQPIYKHWNINLKTLLGAAGGGGIDIGSGLIFQYSAGIEHKLTKKSYVFATIGKYEPLKGNFDPYSLDIGFKIHLYQLVKK